MISLGNGLMCQMGRVKKKLIMRFMHTYYVYELSIFIKHFNFPRPV